jgi:hypothetical protein
MSAAEVRGLAVVWEMIRAWLGASRLTVIAEVSARGRTLALSTACRHKQTYLRMFELTLNNRPQSGCGHLKA